MISLYDNRCKKNNQRLIAKDKKRNHVMNLKEGFMKETIESLTKQGNTWFLAGNNNKALLYYYKTLQQAKALHIVVKYVQKNNDNLYEDQELLKELLQTKYHIPLFPGALPLILTIIKKQVEEKEEKKAYQRFKKIIHCLVTKGTASDHKQLKKILKECDWLRVDIILGDKGYDTRECFNEITNHGSIPGIKVRKNASRKAHGCPSRRKTVIAQQQDIESWKRKVQATMRCVAEAIFSGTKRRFGEYFFSIKARFRAVEIWLRTILWNVLIYPR